MIVITGAAGFIGSFLTGFLNRKGIEDIVLVDDFSFPEKNKNLEGKKFAQKVERTDFIDWLEENAAEVKFIYHLGARTDTTEFDQQIFDELNLNYSKAVWNLCTSNQIPLLYASSGATYGLGEKGYSDSHDIVDQLKPLNPYGDSKNDFDKWVLQQEQTPPNWYGVKFFNVYGPNEFHKGRMASVVFHAFNQIEETGKMKLFQSHNSEYRDGEQQRDFIYVWDLANICHWLEESRPKDGLYNIGTGEARTFLDLVNATFTAMGKTADISFIPTPEDIRDKYQYYTEADMSKLRKAGYNHRFHTLEEGVSDYVTNYLDGHHYY